MAAGTPLRRAVDDYLQKDYARFHMPGHKGMFPSFLGDVLRYDITEVKGADSLYEAAGPIAESEERFAALYGTAASLLSAGGSTLCIQAMLALAVRPGGKILCGRGVHTAAVNAMALLDLHPAWLFPAADPATGLSLPVTATQVEEALRLHPDAAAVYLTSPNYFGVTCDIAEIAPLCRERGIPLLVDNAHGAHLRFLTPDRHPISLGADICCDSLHKTLPVLTGGALLQIGNDRYREQAKRRMSLFGSTSPSYLILQSADEILAWLEGTARAELAEAAARVAELAELAADRGFLLPAGQGDPLRLSLGFGPTGLTRDEWEAHLAEWGVEPEYCADAFCVFLVGPANTDRDFDRLRQAVENCPFERAVVASSATTEPNIFSDVLPRQAVSLREAALAETEKISLDGAEGRICGGSVTPCPPGTPLVVPGEMFDLDLCAALKRYGISSVSVLK